jgi:hypothetical protein
MDDLGGNLLLGDLAEDAVAHLCLPRRS